MVQVIENNQLKFGNYAAVVVGTGFFGSTIAERIANELRLPVLMVEKRDKVGGNARSEIDEVSKIEYHLYGPHIFHTSNRRVWNYVRNFTDFNDYRHHVWADHGGQLFPMPISLATMSQFWGKILSPSEAREKINESIVPCANPANFEEKALALIGRDLYEAFIAGYTEKQWQVDPRNLPASVFGRLPVRFNLNTRYFDDHFEGIPIDGYSRWIENMLDSELIEVAVNTDWFDVRSEIPAGLPVVYTGPVDQFFDYQFGPLGWRTLDFEFEVLDTGDFQGAAQINHSDLSTRHTRTVEYKHFHPERRVESNLTIISREISRLATQNDEPYYPTNALYDRDRLKSYRARMGDFSDVHFGGRLGSYKYLDMHMAIASALTLFDTKVREQVSQRQGW